MFGAPETLKNEPDLLHDDTLFSFNGSWKFSKPQAAPFCLEKYSEIVLKSIYSTLLNLFTLIHKHF